MIGLFRKKINFRKYIDDIIQSVSESNNGLTINFGNLENGRNAEAVFSFDTENVSINIDQKFTIIKSMNDFINFSVAMFHESRHISQYSQIIEGDCDADALLSHIAGESNLDYYLANYKYDVTEIDAEHYGLMKTYFYLQNNFPEENAEELILEYVQSNKDTELYAMIKSETIKNIYDLDSAFDNAKQQVGNHYVYYFVGRTRDVAANYMRNHRDVFERFIDLNSKIERDKLLTAIHMELYPNHRHFIDDNPNVNDKEIYSLLSQREIPELNDNKGEDNYDYGR